MPPPDNPIDQGDIIDGCPLVTVENYDPVHPDPVPAAGTRSRVVVLTQTCDLANQKATLAVVAAVRDAQSLVEKQLLKPSDIRGPIRAGRVFGWYFFAEK
jgi:hypothetical protein